MPVRRRLLACLISFACLAAAAANPTTQPAPAPTARPPYLDLAHLRLYQLTARATRELAADDLDGARATLSAALAIDPGEPTDLYNLARLDAHTGRPAEAVAHLRAAAENGFADPARVATDPALAPLRDRPDYQALWADQPACAAAAADRALAALRLRFGPGYLYGIDAPNKLVFATHTDRATLLILMRDLAAQARSQWAQLFPHHPDGYTNVVIASPADYARLRPAKNVLGFYTPANHTLVASGLGHVIAHEFTHALHAGDLETTGQQPPIWVAEGLAVLFERADLRGPQGDVLTPEPNIRLYDVLLLKRAGRLVRLDALLRLQPAAFMARSSACYAEAGGVMAFLYDQGLLRRFYDAVKADDDVDPTGRLALEQATGHPLPMVERDWWQWLSTRRPPPLYTGPGGAWLGFDFAQATDGLTTTAVTPAGPADRAGLRPGDVVVGLDHMDVRDRGTFVPLLAAHRPGETVTLDVRRGSEYLAFPATLGTRPLAGQGATRLLSGA